MHFLGLSDGRAEAELLTISRRREELSPLRDEQLRSVAAQTRLSRDVTETFALTAVVAERVLGLRMFDVQLLGALALQRGEIAEMKTGEGKTLAAVPAIIW
jgi:preprotein translocase subunit SecA